jgi:hypothetical protein
MAGAGTRGRVSGTSFYGNVTIAFDADFDSNTVVIGKDTIQLNRVNTILVDNIDSVRTIAARRWIEPTLPLDADWNVHLARKSPEFLNDLRCDVPMPSVPLRYAQRQPPVITVCEMLGTR